MFYGQLVAISLFRELLLKDKHMKKRLLLSLFFLSSWFNLFSQEDSPVVVNIKDSRFVFDYQIPIDTLKTKFQQVLKENSYIIDEKFENTKLNKIEIEVSYLNFYESSAKTVFGKGMMVIKLICPSNYQLNEDFSVSVDLPFTQTKLKYYGNEEYKERFQFMEKDVIDKLTERGFDKINSKLTLMQNEYKPNLPPTYYADVLTNSGGNREPSDKNKGDTSLLQQKSRMDYALIFATDEYDEIGDLVNPVNDAQTIANELKDNYGFETETVFNATKNEILAKLREYAGNKYHPDNQLLIFFAGHGMFDDVFGEGYIVCKDSRFDDEIKTSYLSHSTLRTIVNNIPCNHIFLVMDVCFGGTFDPLIANTERGGDGMYKGISQQEFIARKLKFTTRRFLTSGGKEYVPDGRPGEHSPFARKFIEALRNYGGQDRILTIGEVLLYIERVQPQPRYGEFGKNQPGSDFIFIAR